MIAPVTQAAMSLDIGTLFVIATCVTLLLGLFLLFAWMQEGLTALAWWGAAYLVGGVSGALWRLDADLSPLLPTGIADVLLFIAVGMIWTAARLFHGRPICWGAMCFGAVVWLAACMVSPLGSDAPMMRIIIGSTIVAVYTFMIAAELSRERRKSLIRRWPALFVPMLHGAIFLFPVALASLGVRSLATGWIAVFAIEVVLYVVGAAFIVLVLAKDRTVDRYKTAAETDPLTGLLNRRGFFEATGALMTKNKPKSAPVSVLAFDLDHFKSINDRFGHDGGDAVLRMFATVVRRTMRAGDIVGRIGGEEFLAVLSGTIVEAGIAAERVRAALEIAAVAPDSPRIPVTVSIGIAHGLPTVPIELLIARADAALYRAKANGRNRVVPDEELITGAEELPAHRRSDLRSAAMSQPPPALPVPMLLR
jgi:diguanylate cyclase (GGDEF)-like protein